MSKQNKGMIHLPKAMIVDLDDTLITYSAAGDAAWRAVCTRHAASVGSGMDAERLFQVLEETRHAFWSDPERHRRGRLNLLVTRRELVAKALDSLGCVDPTLAETIADEFSTLQYEWLEWFPGAEKTLETLRRDRVRLILATNGQTVLQRAKIRRFHLERFFSDFLIEEELGYGKPDPRVYEKALFLFRLPSSEVWMVGDNLAWDVKGAQDAGMTGIWIDFRNQGLPAGSDIRPNRILKSFSSLYGSD